MFHPKEKFEGIIKKRKIFQKKRKYGEEKTQWWKKRW